MVCLLCMFRKDFRVDFRDLVALRTLIPNARILALTATASLAAVRRLRRELEMPSAVIVKVNPNRRNIYLQKQIRSTKSDESYGDILKPMAKELGRLKGGYELTIVYAKLACITNVFRWFIKFTDEVNTDGLRRFAMFHSATHPSVKSRVIAELGKEVSFIRIVVATQALGMGVDTKHVRRVVHITPSSTLESYFQEIGRAGRDGKDATAVLWYNNSDIARNRTNVSEEMKEYCRKDGCLRAYILSYFGFSAQNQKRCCSNCNPEKGEVIHAVQTQQLRFRSPPSAVELPQLREEIMEVLGDFNFFVENSEIMFAQTEPLGDDCATHIINEAEFVESKSYFIKFGIWHDDYMSSMFGIICKYCHRVPEV